MEQKETEGQPTNSLLLEWAYMDGMHSRVRGYKTQTLYTYHPGMNKVMALAMMECQNKNTQMIKLSFKHLTNVYRITQVLTTNLTHMILCVMREVQI